MQSQANRKEQKPVIKQAPFNHSALSNLSLEDQERFVRFGQGPHQNISFETIHSAVEYQSQKHHDQIAAIHHDQQITYGELNRQADSLAVTLAEYGIGKGDNVGLFVERSIPMLVGILAVLKTGAAYVPQDARITPSPVMASIIESASIKLVLTLSHLQKNIPDNTETRTIAIDRYLDQTSKNRVLHSINLPKSPSTKEDNCFVLFTSGTTGKPNGVKVTHGNVCNILLTEPGNLGIVPGHRVAQLLNIAFDMAAWEILGCLSNGATLVIRGKDFTETAKRCDVIIATPSILGAIDADQCHKAKTVAVAGEPCPLPLAEKWAAQCRFYNSCGPTETTIINTAQEYSPLSQQLTIGKPTPNNRVYVLDENLQPCKIGETGELWAGGAGVTAGYINNSQLTDERYLPDPFVNDGSKMFRTRDLGRWNSEGELEHFGRTDDQVKIRGFRVELDSVSTVLETVEGCLQATTLKLDKANLVSFVRPASINAEQCRQAINAALPYYCEPSVIIPLEKLPITSRGKLDKRALLAMAESALSEKTTKKVAA